LRADRSAVVFAGALALAVLVLTSGLRWTPYNNLSLLAAAFVHGHPWIESASRPLGAPLWGITNDALLWNGHRYVIEGVLPALLLVPFALVFGEHTNQTFLAIGLGTLATCSALVLFRRLGTPLPDALLLTATFFAGTSLLWCAMLGDVWFLEHVAAVCFTLFALLELTGRRRGWVVGLCAGCAFESRFTLALAVPFYAVLLARGGLLPEAAKPDPALVRRSLGTFALALVPFAAGYLAWNEIRWGTLADIGYTEFFHGDSWGQPAGSPFRLEYLPYELYSFFLQPPQLVVDARHVAVWPYFKAGVDGIALTFTTPMLVLALRAQAPRRYLTLMWLLIAAVWLPSLCYYLDGWTQFGMRHALDFEPFWFALIALSARDGLPGWGRLLCAYSVAFGAWGVWYWNAFVRWGY
jgi:hypothetical protein